MLAHNNPSIDRVSNLKESAAYRRGLHPSSLVPSMQELVMAIREINRKSRNRQNESTTNIDPVDSAKAEILNSIHQLLKLSLCEHNLFAQHKQTLMDIIEARLGSVYASSNPTIWLAQAQMGLEMAVQSVQEGDNVDRCIITGLTGAINNIIYQSVAARNGLDVEDLIGNQSDEEVIVSEDIPHITPTMRIVSISPVYAEEGATDVSPAPVFEPQPEPQPKEIEMTNFNQTNKAASIVNESAAQQATTSVVDSDVTSSDDSNNTETVSVTGIEMLPADDEVSMFKRMKNMLTADVEVTVPVYALMGGVAVGGGLGYLVSRKLRIGNGAVIETAKAFAGLFIK